MITAASSRQEVYSLKQNLMQTVLGCEDQIDLVIIGLLAGGHILIQGAPGMGKTSLAKGLAHSLDCKFRRIQFTPDLLPADILGYSIYEQSSGEFRFHPGAIFSNIVLADEINRTTPRIQSALLEAMNEAQVSIDGQTRELGKPFYVIATQNHLNTVGTFPLPESQLDRFLLSFDMPRPGLSTQTAILKQHWQNWEPEKSIEAVLTQADVVEMQGGVQKVTLDDSIMEYIARLSEATHDDKAFYNGVSPRANLALMRASQANAWLDGRDHVYPDDVKELLPYVYGHRLSVRKRFRKGDGDVFGHLATLLSEVPVP